MLCDPSGPADIIQSEERMIFHGVSIPLTWITPPTIRRVTVDDCVEVSPMEEVIVDAYVDRDEHVIDEEEHQLLVEMQPNLLEGYDCLLAPTVVNAANTTDAPMCIFNPHSKPIAIRQDSVIGWPEPVNMEYAMAKHENLSEIGNVSAVRCVTLRETSEPKGKVHPSRCQARLQRQSIARKANIQVPTYPLPEHLKGLHEQGAKSKSKMECPQIHSLLLKHERVFSKDDYDLGHTNLVEHTIDTGNAKPIKEPPRWVPMAFAGEEHKVLEKLHAQGAISPSTSPWSSPIVLVQKKSGQVHPCVDYWQFNKVTKDVVYPIPRTQDYLDAMSGTTMFSTMEIISAYNQVPVAEQDIPKMVFVTKYGLYEFTKMPFGLSTSPQTYEHLTELTLSGLQWSLCLIYLDDVIAFFHEFE